MHKSNFIHLHNHSDYSFFESAITIKNLLNFALENNMESIALTDNSGLFGATYFCEEAIKLGIKPILGFQTSISGIPIILLCKNRTGYLNLLKIVSLSSDINFPTTHISSMDILFKNVKGLIALVDFYKTNQNAEALLLKLKNIFNQKDLYLEIQKSKAYTMKKIVQLSLKFNIELVATNNNRVLKSSNKDLLNCLQAIKNKSKLIRSNYPTKEYPYSNFFRSSKEMQTLFSHLPNALLNSVKIADRCNYVIEKENKAWPTTTIPKGFNTGLEYITKLCLDSIVTRYLHLKLKDKKIILSRIKYELDFLDKNNKINYFLIIYDIMIYAKNSEIAVDCGIGTVSCSLVAFLLGLSNSDPIKYNFPFERYMAVINSLNSEIIIYIEYPKYHNIINYLLSKYGKDNLALVSNIDKIIPLKALTDVAKTLDISEKEVKTAINFISEGYYPTLLKCLQNPKFSKYFNSTKKHKEWLNLALEIDGLVFGFSLYYDYINITKNPIMEHTSLSTNETDKLKICQYDKNYLEKNLGVLKLPLFKSKYLAVINNTVKLIKENLGVSVAIDNLNLEDKKIYDLLSKGETIGVEFFEVYVEEPIIMEKTKSEYFRELKPDSFKDILIFVALNCNYTIEIFYEYIKRKEGIIKCNYMHESIKHILKETYGIIVYKEQFMQIAHIIGDFPLVNTYKFWDDMLRKKDTINSIHLLAFIKGAAKKKISPELAENIFNELFKFSSYVYNKTMAVGIAYSTYQAAWLKVYYPNEFMQASYNSRVGNENKVKTILEEADRMGIKLEI